MCITVTVTTEKPALNLVRQAFVRISSPQNAQRPVETGRWVSGDCLLLRSSCRRVFDRQQFQIKYQYRVGWNRRARALSAVSQFTRDVQFGLLANVHQLQGFNPAWDHAANRQINLAAALD